MRKTIVFTLEKIASLLRRDAKEGDVLEDFRGGHSSSELVIVTDANLGTFQLQKGVGAVRPGCPNMTSLYKDCPVRKVGHFRFVDPVEKEEAKPAPVVVSCLDPLDKLLRTNVGGMTGAQCLAAYEQAQRADNGIYYHRRGGDPHGPKHLIAGSMSIEQTALAVSCWEESLRALQRDNLRREEQRVLLPVDDDDVLIPVRDAKQ
jgi:hypothetical protein